MAYSTIKRPCCKCGCGKSPTIQFDGWRFDHAPESIKEKVGTKKQAQVKRSNAKKAVSAKLRADNRKKDELGVTVKENWFLQRRKEMTGICNELGCRNTTNKNNDEFFRWSICHVVPKSIVSSVAYHPENFLELCQSHHEEFDNTFERAFKMKCFGEAKRKFEIFKSLIPPEELRKVNPHLL